MSNDVQNLEKLKYPIGDFQYDPNYSGTEQNNYLLTIEEFPGKFRKLVSTFNEKQLDSKYRPGGWTVRQVIHHMPDSHLNSYLRFRWAMTEEKPVIKAYLEGKFAEMMDYENTPIEVSLDLLESLHKRWIILLNNLSDEDWKRTFIHPENGKEISLREMLPLYAWHCEHHFEHVNQLKLRKGW